jgi:hypothetical protein
VAGRDQVPRAELGLYAEGVVPHSPGSRSVQ